MKYNKDTKLILSVSNSPGNFGTFFHNYLYEQLNINAFYKSTLSHNIQNAIVGMRDLNIFGMSVSMPYKKSVLPLLDHVDDSAKTANSVNTIINVAGKLTGYSTDLYALSIISKKITKQSTIMIIGSGAIAELCISFFKSSKIGIISRNKETTARLQKVYSHLSEYDIHTEYELAINTTPQDLNLITDKDLSRSLDKALSLIDYPVRHENYQRKGINKSQQYIAGLDITTLQAVKQFEIYTEVELDETLVTEALNYAKS